MRICILLVFVTELSKHNYKIFGKNLIDHNKLAESLIKFAEQDPSREVQLKFEIRNDNLNTKLLNENNGNNGNDNKNDKIHDDVNFLGPLQRSYTQDFYPGFQYEKVLDWAHVEKQTRRTFTPISILRRSNKKYKQNNIINVLRFLSNQDKIEVPQAPTLAAEDQIQRYDPEPERRGLVYPSDQYNKDDEIHPGKRSFDYYNIMDGDTKLRQGMSSNVIPLPTEPIVVPTQPPTTTVSTTTTGTTKMSTATTTTERTNVSATSESIPRSAKRSCDDVSVEATRPAYMKDLWMHFGNCGHGGKCSTTTSKNVTSDEDQGSQSHATDEFISYIRRKVTVKRVSPKNAKTVWYKLVMGDHHDILANTSTTPKLTTNAILTHKHK